LHVNLLPESDIDQRLRTGITSLAEREEAIAKLFGTVGCQVEKEAVDKKNNNVICSLKGETDETIIVGGHFDFVESGKGIVDDWSGTALLPSLYATLKEEPRHHTFRFVAFANEEKGLVGSSKYVKLNKSDLGKVRAFVNLECLGLGPPNVWVHRSTPMLLSRLAEVAKAVNVPLRGVDVDNIGDDDTHPFFSKDIPVVSIHSVTQESLAILHSVRDDYNAVKQQDYYTSYKLVSFYLAYLDQMLTPTKN
jgi:Zn-dependent M28 family amino/carboxypeptidase